MVNGTAPSKMGVRTMLKQVQISRESKSFVNDLNIKRGIVSMRVAFVPRSVEIKKRETFETSIVGRNSAVVYCSVFFCLRVNISLTWSKMLLEGSLRVL
jgi:hypothetical protein